MKKTKSDTKKKNMYPVQVSSLVTQRSRRSIINKYVSSSAKVRTTPVSETSEVCKTKLNTKRKPKEKLKDVSVPEQELAAMFIKEKPLDDVPTNYRPIDVGTTKWCEIDIKREKTINDNHENTGTKANEKSMKKQRKTKVLKEFWKKIVPKQQESVKSEHINNAEENSCYDNSDENVEDTAHGLIELWTKQDDDFQCESVESKKLQGRPKGRKTKSYKKNKSKPTAFPKDSEEITVDETKHEAFFDESECNWHYSNCDSDETDGHITIGDDNIQRSEKKQNIVEEVKNSKYFKKADLTDVTRNSGQSLECDNDTISVTDILNELEGVIENPDEKSPKLSPKKRKFRCDEYEEHKPFCKENAVKVFTDDKTSYKCKICNARASGLQYLYYHVIRMHTKKSTNVKYVLRHFPCIWMVKYIWNFIKRDMYVNCVWNILPQNSR